MSNIKPGDFVTIKPLSEIKEAFPHKNCSSGLHFLDSPNESSIAFCIERSPYCGYECEVLEMHSDGRSFKVRRPFPLPDGGAADVDFYLDPRMVDCAPELGSRDISNDDFENLFLESENYGR